MADLSIAQIEVLGVGLLHPLHQSCQRRVPGLDQQIDVIGHQAIGVKAHLALCAVLIQPVEIRFVILIASKRLAPLVAPDSDLIEQYRREDSGTAGHDPIITKNRDHLSRLYRLLCLTPIPQ